MKKYICYLCIVMLFLHILTFGMLFYRSSLFNSGNAKQINSGSMVVGLFVALLGTLWLWSPNRCVALLGPFVAVLGPLAL